MNFLLRRDRASVFGNLLSFVRNAGGGGRPGGRPAFNWKEKQQLRLANKATKKLRTGPVGNFSDIESFIDEKNGDRIIDLSKITEAVFKFPDLTAEREIKNNTKKTIDIQMLFGSSKPYGPLIRRFNKYQKTFSHKRLREETKEQSSSQ